MLSKPISLIVVLALLNGFSSYSQINSNDSIKTQSRKQRPAKRNGIWFTPTKAKELNGFVLGTLPSSMFNNDTLHINGIHLEINPVALFAVPYVIIGSFISPFKKTDSTKVFGNAFPDSIETNSNAVSGLNLSVLGSLEMNDYKGINISSVATGGKSMKGISITIGVNSFFEFYGVLIAGLTNNVNKGNGLQIALFNRCKDCKGLQIGLLNTIGKRTLPFINVQF